MKLTAVLANAFIGLAVANPFSEIGGDAGLEARNSYGRCKYKDQRCCQYQDRDFEGGRDYPNGDSHQYGRTIYVKHGKSIQRAINSASRGDRIVVAAGTYSEQLTIKTDGIQLIGHNAVLVPPKSPVQNKCSGLVGPGSQAGICITGSGVELTKFVTEHRRVSSVKQPVKNVVVTGFQVNKFSGVNVAVVGAVGVLVTKNTLTDAGAYGGLTLGSFNTVFKENVVTTTKEVGFVGICMDNKSGVLVTNNDVSNQFIGLCVQTAKADVEYNKVSTSCVGVYVDPGVNGAKVRHNHIVGFNPICGQFNVGIILDGPIKTKVLDNVIEGQKTGKSIGIFLGDNTCVVKPPDQLSLSCIVLGHAATASGNIILRNKLTNNDLDIQNKSKGKGNVIACNSCSTPAKYCKH
ncbi:pectin lyase fold/virulence factor [Mariannaea sp. PMI_226]|nr:pectin lyase fold/virulence factor [Mariannaea sp. PMI_226]